MLCRNKKPGGNTGKKLLSMDSNLDKSFANPKRVGVVPLSEFLIFASSFNATSRRCCSEKYNVHQNVLKYNSREIEDNRFIKH